MNHLTALILEEYILKVLKVDHFCFCYTVCVHKKQVHLLTKLIILTEKSSEVSYSRKPLDLIIFCFAATVSKYEQIFFNESSKISTLYLTNNIATNLVVIVCKLILQAVTDQCIVHVWQFDVL